MFKNLKMLLKLRSWIKSDTLKAGGLVGLLGAAQVFFTTGDGMQILDLIATFVGLMTGTLSGIVLGLIGLIMIVLRAKTEWSLAEKNDDAHKQEGFSVLAAMVLALVMGVALFFALAPLT